MITQPKHSNDVPLRQRTASQQTILPLPDDVIAQIKSSTTIVSLNHVVLELLKNSLDAKASQVDVTVDFARGGCTVEMTERAYGRSISGRKGVWESFTVGCMIDRSR